MQGDFSRWTFDRRAGYRSVLLQQGRLLLDADWNEQTQITAHHDEVRTLDLLGGAGGPLGVAAFGLLDAVGNPPSNSLWPDLRITPGRFYVDGVLAEVEPDPAGPGPALAAQPFLPGAPGKALPGLPEPSADGRYAVVLELREDHVTADEAPRLRESALGGPDTTTRSRTIWQLTLRKVEEDESCAIAAAEPWLRDKPPTMTASLIGTPPEEDPCQITTSAGYRRLENQLYRVEVHDVEGGVPRYLWSRENGSVVAGLTAIGPSATMDAELSLDREGRDEELSIGPGEVVEVTSAGRRLHGLPGFLARSGAPQGQTLPVEWLGAAPADLDSLGQAPIVRRWEGEPRAADASADELEGGIQVSFGAGEFRVCDYWLIPARTVRLVYGQTALAGTIEWPADGAGAALPLPPVGARRHRTVVALLDRTTSSGKGRWTLWSDCRKLTPPLTRLTAIDLLGGDGQEALPGTQLPQPIRVAVRNGAVAVPGAKVAFVASAGGLAKPPANAGTAPTSLTVETDVDGHAEVRWQLPTGGAPAQSLTATLLDDADNPVGAEVRVGARLSIASQVGYDPAECAELELAKVRTVQEAIDVLCKHHGDVFPGFHVLEVVSLNDGKEIVNDSTIDLPRLLGGVRVVFDAEIDPRCAKAPVFELAVDVPWPMTGSDTEYWSAGSVGTQTVTLGGTVDGDGASIVWRPQKQHLEDLSRILNRLLALAKEVQEPFLVRLLVRGNAVTSKDGKRFLNGRAFGRPKGEGIALDLPSVDDVHGADFRMWFRVGLSKKAKLSPRIVVEPHQLSFLEMSDEQLTVTIRNVGEEQLKFGAEAVTTSPIASGNYQLSEQSGSVPPGGSRALVVTSSSFSRGLSFVGELRISSNDPFEPEVVVDLSTGSGIIIFPGGPFRLKPVREEFARIAPGPALPGPTPQELEAPRLQKELEKRGQPLRLAVAPGFEQQFEATRAQLAAAGVEVERVDGDPVELARQADAGKIVVDGVLGDAGLGNRIAAARKG